MSETLPIADLIEDVEFLARHGVDQHEAARRLGYRSWKSLDHRLRNHKRGDLSRRLVANNRLNDRQEIPA